jgi:hypothetical protein
MKIKLFLIIIYFHWLVILIYCLFLLRGLHKEIYKINILIINNYEINKFITTLLTNNLIIILKLLLKWI